MKNKLIVALIFTMIISISFNACSNSSEDKVTEIDINVKCLPNPTGTDIENHISLLEKDSVVKDEDNTTVSIYYDTQGTKKVCLVEGKAHILR